MSDQPIEVFNIGEMFEAIVPGFKEWLHDKDYRNYTRFSEVLDVTNPESDDRKATALVKAAFTTEVFAKIGAGESVVMQCISFIALGYFLALKEYKLLEKDLH